MTLINKAFCDEAKDEIIFNLSKQLNGEANKNFFCIKDSQIDVSIRTSLNQHTKLVKFEVYVSNQMVGSGTHKSGGKIYLDKDFVDKLGENIFIVLINTIHKDSGVVEDIENMLRGVTTSNEVNHPYGVTIKFHTDDDHQVMLITKGKDTLYALEEAINLEEGVGPDLFTPVGQLKGRIMNVLRHVAGREDFTVEYEFTSTSQF